MKQNRIVTMALIALLTVFTLHVLNRSTEGARVDLTETKLYSLTQGTQDILAKMREEGVKPIDIKLYFSETTGKQLPQFINRFTTYKNDVHNLIKEYERDSGGKIRISYIDPKTDSDEADDASDYGLDGKAINEYGDRFFFGLAFVTQTGSKDAIDFLWPEKQDTIEYEISKKIYNLLWPKKQRIGLLAGVDVMPDNNPYMAQLMRAQGKQPTEPWIVSQLLQESYTLTRIDKDADTISKDDYDLLLVIHPKGFSDKTLWNINEWVVTGGNAIFFLDTYSITDQPPQNPQQPFAQLQYKSATDMSKLLQAWGLSRTEDAFAADFELGFKGPIDRRGTIGKVITDINISEKTAAKTLNQDVVIFNGLNDLRFYMPGVLEEVGGTDLTYTQLITTTDQGDALTIMPGFGGGDGALAYTDLGAPDKLINAYNPSGKKALAYMLNGTFPSAFPDGASFPAKTPEAPPGMPPGFQMPPDENAEMVEKEAIPSDQFAESRVLIYADTDLIADQVAFSQSFFGTSASNDNHKVLLNSIDFLLGAEELMNVRSKPRINRPFELFDEIESRADESMLAQEQQIRGDIERFQQEVRDKQSGMNQKDAVLFQKKLLDDVDELNVKIREGEKQLREIRKQKRALLDGEKANVRFAIVWLMPIIVFLFGLFSWYSNHQRKKQKVVTRKG